MTLSVSFYFINVKKLSARFSPNMDSMGIYEEDCIQWGGHVLGFAGISILRSIMQVLGFSIFRKDYAKFL